MNPLFSLFLERLAERFTGIFAAVVSTRVESLRAEAQAEQQSQLEDLARKYEADGKVAIARTLRERALALTSTNLASGGLEVMQLVSGETLKLDGTSPTAAPGQRNSLPDFTITADSGTKSRRRGQAAMDSRIPDAPGDAS